MDQILAKAGASCDGAGKILHLYRCPTLVTVAAPRPRPARVWRATIASDTRARAIQATTSQTKMGRGASTLSLIALIALEEKILQLQIWCWGDALGVGSGQGRQ